MTGIPDFIQTEDPSFTRDTRNRALLNTDKAALQRHRAQRAKALSTARRVDMLEAEVSELKALIQQLLKAR